MTYDAVQSLVADIAALESETTTLTITGDRELRVASDMLARVARLRKRLEERRKHFTAPLNESLRRINDFFKKWLEPLDRVDGKLRAAIVEYRARREQERRDEEELARLKREVAAEHGETLPDLPPPPPPPATVRTEAGTVTTRKVWTFEVVDESLVPREYLTVDAKKIRAVQAGVREIPGVRIYETEQVAVRA